MAIGPALQEARLKKQLTPSQVAELTRMKVQIVNDLEVDDFHRIAATIYGKGFIKLFAECVGLDPKPLIADYVRGVEGDKPSLIPDGVDSPAPQPTEEKKTQAKRKPDTEREAPPPEPPAESATDLFTYAKTRRVRVTSDSTQHGSVIKDSLNAKANATGSLIEKNWSGLVEKLRHYTESIGTRLTEIPWGDAPLKIIGVVIGLLLVLLFVVSGLSRCTGPHSTNTPISDALHIAVDPPEPYFDD